MSKGDINWSTPISFGQHKDESILNVKIKYPKYLAWCFVNELHLKYPELEWLFDNLKKHELKQIGIK
jgi:hypothetical protein